MDVHLFQTRDGGEISFGNGEPAFTSGLETAVYLSLWGGNERDSGSSGDTSLEWWGNKGERLPERKLRSETQYLLRSVPLVPANLIRIHDAATRDLGWMVNGFVDEVTVQISLPALNTVQLSIQVRVGSDLQRFVFLFAR